MCQLLSTSSKSIRIQIGELSDDAEFNTMVKIFTYWNDNEGEIRYLDGLKYNKEINSIMDIKTKEIIKAIDSKVKIEIVEVGDSNENMC